MPLDGSWVILDEFMNEGDWFSGPWTWSSAVPVTWTCTDLFVVTDSYEIYDNGVLVYSTPYKPDWDVLGYPDPFTAPPYEVDPDLALASGFFCHGSIDFGAGSHSITIRNTHVPLQADGTPFGDSTIAFKAEPQLGSAFAVENYPGTDFIRFETDNPANQTVISSATGSAVEPFAMDFDLAGTTLYALDWATFQLGTIDTSTGSWNPYATVTPAWSGTVTGMTVDPTTGTWYVSSSDGGTAYLYTLNIATGALAGVGSTGTDALRIDIAVDLYGVMYGHDINTDSLYTINKSTGAASLIGPTGYDANFAQGMDVDFSTNTLYATMFFPDLSSSFARIDTSSGAATLIPGLIDGAEYELAFQEPAGVLDQPGIAYCFGDPGVGTPCPCSNDNDGSVLGSGCDNGVNSSGARLTASGVASVGTDTLKLTTTGVEPTNWGLYFQAENRTGGGAGTVFGDGLRCAGGDLRRLQPRPADANGMSFTTVVISVKAGNVSPGDVKRYQYWYRTQVAPPCGLGVNDFNLSNGYEVQWQL